MSNFATKSKELEIKRAELADLYAKARNEDGTWKDITTEQQTEFVQRNSELKSLVDEAERLKELDVAYAANMDALKSAQKQVTNKFAGGSQETDLFNGKYTQNTKSLGEFFTESPIYQDRGKYGRQPFAVEVKTSAKKALDPSADAIKTLMTTTAGLAPYPPRMTEIIPFPVRQPVVADLMPNIDTTAPSIIYLEITTWTNNAAPVAEGGTKPEAAIVGTQRTVPMIKVAVTLPVTEEQMDDIPGIQDFIDSTLRTMVVLAEDADLLTGTGSTPDQYGFLTKPGTQSEAKGADDRFTAAYKGLTKVRSIGFANPTGWVIHPNDWQTLATQQDSTGRFILGNPGDNPDLRLWGLPVVLTVAETAGTMLTGDFKTWAKVYRRMELRVDVGYINDQFTKNQMTIRAEERLALVIFRPLAFCLVTGV